MPLSYEPLDIVPPADNTGAPSMERVECPTCETVIAGGNVATSVVEHDAERGMHLRQRFFYCAHCRKVFAWSQACFEDGRLQPVRIGALDVIEAPNNVRWFLRNYPILTNVEM